MDCGICLEKKDNINANYPCGHLFCIECILNSIEINGKKCPVCNSKINDTIKIYLNNENVIENKIDHLISLNCELEETRKILQYEINQYKLAITKLKSTLNERKKFIEKTHEECENIKRNKLKELNNFIVNMSNEFKKLK